MLAQGVQLLRSSQILIGLTGVFPRASLFLDWPWLTSHGCFLAAPVLFCWSILRMTTQSGPASLPGPRLAHTGAEESHSACFNMRWRAFVDVMLCFSRMSKRSELSAGTYSIMSCMLVKLHSTSEKLVMMASSEVQQPQLPAASCQGRPCQHREKPLTQRWSPPRAL